MNIAREPFLVAQRGHPGAASLRRTGEIVAEENAAMASRAVAHLPRSHVLMPDRHVVATLEGQAEEAARGVERGFDDSIELEIWLDRRFVDVAARLAQLLRVMAPVPRRQREIFALRLHQRLQGIAIGERTASRRRPDAIEQSANGVRRLRHGVIQPKCAKLAYPSSRARSARNATISAMIALLSVGPPPSPRAIQARNTFSRRSRRAENCRKGSTLEREMVMTCLPASPRCSAAARAAAHTKSGSPARSSSPSSTSV